MREIILVKEVNNEVCSNEKETYTLIGTPFLKSYDLIFDALPLKPEDLGKIADANYLIVPVLSSILPEQRDKFPIEAHTLHKKSPIKNRITLMALRDKEKKYSERYKKEIEGPFLKFYRIRESKYGIELIAEDSYKIISQKNLERLLNKIPTEKSIKERKKGIESMLS